MLKCVLGCDCRCLVDADASIREALTNNEGALWE